MEIHSVNPQNEVLGAPPPPPEVKVRTMKSDLESMARSGGGAPIFQDVVVAGLAQPADGTSGVANRGAGDQRSSKSLVGPILVAIVAIIALAVVGYFAYAAFFVQR